MPFSTTTTTTTTGFSHCPYAVALHEESDHTDEEDYNVAEAVKSCPAFEQGSCPFKDTEKVRETLAKIPPSHFEPTGKFFKVVKELHSVNAANAANSSSNSDYHLPGGCPVQQQQPKTANTTNDASVASFTTAMESYSLAAIMARLAKKQGLVLQVEESSESEDDTEHDDTAVTSNTVTVTTADDAAELLLLPPSLPPPRPSLAHALKIGTAVSHQAAEDVHFVSNFIKGIIDRELYGKLVVMLYHVYDKLEDSLQQAGPVEFPTCHFPNELGRTDALLEDLDFWHGGKVDEKSTAVQDYMDRLDYLTANDPLLLLAHSYTRYLGDLSGGKILARVARRALLLGDEGLAFYEFSNIASPKRFKDMYRQAMDALPLTADQVERLVAEANVAFLLNMRLFEELDVLANVPGASVRSLDQVMVLASGNAASAATSNITDKEAECPFLVRKKSEGATATSTASKCPWPFILAHDPAQGMRAWQTWTVLGLFMCWAWAHFVQQAVA